MTATAERALEWLEGALAERLEAKELEWWNRTREEVAEGVTPTRFSLLLSSASRWVKKRPLAPADAARASAGEILEGWNPERWSAREAARVGFVLSRYDLDEEGGAAAIEDAFRFSDESEAVALYRSLAFLPHAERYVWRAGEGCRSNMLSVFEAVALDTPFPFANFDDATFDQAAIKAIFVGAPLWRLYGLDRRLTPKLAGMALDLADERRSAHREVQADLWLTLGSHGGDRGLASIEQELDSGSTLGRSAAALALARAGRRDDLAARLERETDDVVAGFMRGALEGRHTQAVFGELQAALTPANT